MNIIGYVVGEVRTDEFTFVTNREIAPPRLEYIVVEVEDPEHNKRVEVLAQVTKLSVSSRLLDTTLSYNEVAQILARISTSPRRVATLPRVGMGRLASTMRSMSWRAAPRSRPCTFA